MPLGDLFACLFETGIERPDAFHRRLDILLAGEILRVDQRLPERAAAAKLPYAVADFGVAPVKDSADGVSASIANATGGS